ncbi:hypothetical protein BJX64DRAFT_285385 [Aspergillus heterothallicus]
MANHIPKCHQACLTDTQLQIMLDMSERPMDETEMAFCPFCPAKSMSLRQLQTHTSRHLEEISLFVINNTHEGTDYINGSLASKLAVRAEDTQVMDESSDRGPSVSIPSQPSIESGLRAQEVPKVEPHQFKEDFSALSGASEKDYVTKTSQWISQLSSPTAAVVDLVEPVLPVRELGDDENFVTRAFERHVEYCDQCKFPLHAQEEGLALCDRGDKYANDVATYLYSKNGKAYSVVDRVLNQRTLVKIPRDFLATRSLLLAIEAGLRLEGNKLPPKNDFEEPPPIASCERTYPNSPHRSLRAIDLGQREPRAHRLHRVDLHSSGRKPRRDETEHDGYDYYR